MSGLPALFVFAHQDDEIVYAGLLRKLASSGREMHVVWVTDGAHYVPAAVRRRESEAVMRMLGIGEDRLEFWDYPDGGSIRFAGEITDRLAEKMREIGPSEVYTDAYEGGHPDHDLAHFAAVTAARRMEVVPELYEAPLYNRYGHWFTVNRFVPAETETLFTRLSRGETLLKMRALLTYRSQLWITVVPILLFNRGAVGAIEPYRKVPAWNYRQPPHEGKLFYEAWLLHHVLHIGYADFREAVSRVVA